LNTTHKIIEINKIIFTDWDEIYDETLNKVINNNNNPIPNASFIHEVLDCGFSDSTKIMLNNKTLVNINNINVDDILENGEKVYGIVEIDGSSILEHFRYNLGENNFIEGYAPNLTFIDKENINMSYKLYHLLTDKGTFKIGNTIIKDYNAAIDRFLENNKLKILSINYV
jgi:hypothetical protein